MTTLLAATMPVADAYTIEWIAFNAALLLSCVIIMLSLFWYAAKDKDPMLAVIGALFGVVAAIIAYLLVPSWTGRASALETSETPLSLVVERINNTYPGLIKEADQPGLERVLACKAEAGSMVACTYIPPAENVAAAGVVNVRAYVAE